jgi:hypothetical protein
MGARKPRYMRVVYLDRDADRERLDGDHHGRQRGEPADRGAATDGRNVSVQPTAPVLDRASVPSVEALVALFPEGYTRDPNLSW